MVWGGSTSFGFGGMLLLEIWRLKSSSTKNGPDYSLSPAHVCRWLMRVALRQDPRWHSLTFRQLICFAGLLINDEFDPQSWIYVCEVMHIAERLPGSSLRIGENAPQVDDGVLTPAGGMATAAQRYFAELALAQSTACSWNVQIALFHAATLSSHAMRAKVQQPLEFYTHILDRLASDSGGETESKHDGID